MLAVVNCSQVVTMRGPKRPRTGPELRELSLLEDGAMLVHDGRIVKVGPLHEIESSLDSNCQVVDAGGRVVLPGFVDAHAHPVFAGNRADEFERRSLGQTYQEIAVAGGAKLRNF